MGEQDPKPTAPVSADAPDPELTARTAEATAAGETPTLQDAAPPVAPPPAADAPAPETRATAARTVEPVVAVAPTPPAPEPAPDPWGLERTRHVGLTLIDGYERSVLVSAELGDRLADAVRVPVLSDLARLQAELSRRVVRASTNRARDLLGA